MVVGFVFEIRHCSSVTQRQRIPILLALLLITGMAFYFTNREPSYNGRTLSSWLKELNPRVVNDDRDSAYEAVRQIGIDDHG